ncbi:MAG: TlpA family protein disulfide reductase [Deltaproteobacteria bacterium]|nr:TlpA family protein disulfide reductase [Deltaproteobacteria bacterium]
MVAWRWCLLLAVSIAVLGAGCGATPVTSGGGTSRPSDGGKSSGGSGEVADFVLKDVDGRSHALTDYLGKNVILISFWATWCEPCKKEMDQLQTLFEAHSTDGLMILSISMDEPETQGDVLPFVKQRGFTYPVLLDTESQVTNQFNPRRSAPFSLIIDRDEKTSWTHEGYVPGDEKKVEAAVLEALGTGAQ